LVLLVEMVAQELLVVFLAHRSLTLVVGVVLQLQTAQVVRVVVALAQ
jgi:hypothetical protein